ncbi:hypothetical protein ACLB1N_33665 [Escherichia coli]
MMLGKSKSNKIVLLDAGLQRRLEELAQNWKGRLPPRSRSAIIVVDHTDMRVRGWVGSVDLNDDSRFGHVDMVDPIRSQGSVLKPFVYGLALDEGLIHPASLLQDVPRRTGDYRPGNFDSGFHGPISMSEALVRSLNFTCCAGAGSLWTETVCGKVTQCWIAVIFAQRCCAESFAHSRRRWCETGRYGGSVFHVARHGKAGKLRLQPDDPLLERPLMSSGAAWIIRRIMADEAQPLPDGAFAARRPTGMENGHQLWLS